MRHDTADMGPSEWRSTITPAEAATEVGQGDRAEPRSRDVLIYELVCAGVTLAWIAGLLFVVRGGVQ